MGCTTKVTEYNKAITIKNKIKQTITKKYKLGNTPGGKVVGVLIKNSDTRRKIQEEHGVLRRESIVEIRKYLHDHGLIKVGSDAPPDVLRNIYESAKMTGEIMIRVIADFKVAQEQGHIRRDLNLGFIPYFLNQINNLVKDPVLLDLYHGNIREVMTELTNFFFYGILIPGEKMKNE